MENGESNTNNNKSPTDSHIPPPTDPYVTYQTPYPRRPSDEVQNPFVEFRRLADATFTSLFSSLPRLLGTEEFKEANIRESDQDFVKAFDEHAKKFENRIAEMVRARTEEAEGFRKKLEQEWEERRRENENRMEEENQRWEMMRRGLEKCPGLKSYGAQEKTEPDTELDLYDALKAYDSPMYKPRIEEDASAAKSCPWKDEAMEKKCPWNPEDNGGQRSWLSGLGWDGRRRAKNIPLYAPSASTKRTQELNAEWQAYRDDDMDPFEKDDHLVPWLKLSPYSPLHLINHLSWGELTNHQKDGAEGQPEVQNLPWDEAFEDLMAVHKVGKLPSLARRVVYWGGPNQWMTDMVLRGSLGTNWTERFMVTALMHAVDNDRWRGFDGMKEECLQLAGGIFRPNCDATSDTMNRTRDETDQSYTAKQHKRNLLMRSRPGKDFDPRSTDSTSQTEEASQSFFGFSRPTEKMFGAHGMQWPAPEAVFQALLEGQQRTGEVLNEVNRDETDQQVKASTSSQDAWSSSATMTSSWASAENSSPESIVSQSTTTTTRTLPDGRTEVRRVLKQRFADGREEQNETTEFRPSKADHAVDGSTQTGDELKQRQQIGGHGWFWN